MERSYQRRLYVPLAIRASNCLSVNNVPTRTFASKARCPPRDRTGAREGG